MALLAISLVGAGLILAAVGSPVGQRLGRTLMWPGASFAITAVLMLASSRFGKLRARDRLLDRLALAGDETVLDVGWRHAEASLRRREHRRRGFESRDPQCADGSGARQAIREIARVVRPGGRAGIPDIAYVADYAREFTAAGWTVERRGFTPWIFPPTQQLDARKPG